MKTYWLLSSDHLCKKNIQYSTVTSCKTTDLEAQRSLVTFSCFPKANKTARAKGNKQPLRLKTKVCLREQRLYVQQFSEKLGFILLSSLASMCSVARRLSPDQMPLELDGFSSSDQAIKVTVMLWVLIRGELRWLTQKTTHIKVQKIEGAKLISS